MEVNFARIGNNVRQQITKHNRNKVDNSVVQYPLFFRFVDPYAAPGRPGIRF